LELQSKGEYRAGQLALRRLRRDFIGCGPQGYNIASNSFCSGAKNPKKANTESAVPDSIQAFSSDQKPLDRHVRGIHGVSGFNPWTFGGDIVFRIGLTFFQNCLERTLLGL